jgi:hypothetical protein
MKYLKSVLASKFYLLVFVIFFLPRIISLGTDITNYDAGFWYPRLDNFAKNVVSGDYGETYQKYHPGVTVLWLSGLPKYAFEQAVESKYGYNPRFMPMHFAKLNFVTIFPLIFFISILGVLSFFIIRKLTSTNFALLFSLLLSLEPFFLGITKFLHLSGLQSMLIFTSVLSIYYYYQNKKPIFFYLSSVLVGLGLLTKIDTVIALVFINFFILYKDFKKPFGLKTIIIKILKYNITSILVFIMLFPALWINPINTLHRIYKEGILDTALSNEGDSTLLKIPQLFYIEALFLRSLATTFIFSLLGIFYVFRKKDNYFIKYNLLFATFMLACLTIPSKTIDRYILDFYPSFMLVSAYGFYTIFNILKNKILKYSLISLISIYYLVVLVGYYPVYSFYYTELIGGQEFLNKIGFPIKNRGEYYAQAAQYINENDTEAIKKIVLVTESERIVTFNPFFYGTTIPKVSQLPKDRSAAYMVVRKNHDFMVPKDKCAVLQEFGPRAPLKYTELTLYKCEGYKKE